MLVRAVADIFVPIAAIGGNDYAFTPTLTIFGHGWRYLNFQITASKQFPDRHYLCAVLLTRSRN